MKTTTILTPSALLMIAQASVDVWSTEEQVRAFDTDSQREWFNLAFKERIDLEKAANTHKATDEAIEKELEEKKGIIASSVNVLEQMMATNQEVETWLGISDLKGVETAQATPATPATPPKEPVPSLDDNPKWKDGKYYTGDDAIAKIWDSRKHQFTFLVDAPMSQVKDLMHYEVGAFY